jgi:hypothetical protein
MNRVLSRVAIAFMLLGVGWTAGRAQVAQPDFEFVIDAPVGETIVTCKRGCTLLWVERGIPSSAKPDSAFRFRCAGQGLQRCSSATVGGWVVP